MATGRWGKQSAAARAALVELCAVLEKSELTPALIKRDVYAKLGMFDERSDLDAAIVDDVKNAELLADGSAGDSVKYKAAALQMYKRWELFLAIYVDGACSEPTLELVKAFTVFIFKYRQRWSSSGRVGLGDAVAHMAQYVLAQVRVRLLCLRVRDVVLQPACRARSHGRRRACVLHARPRPGRSSVTVLQGCLRGLGVRRQWRGRRNVRSRRFVRGARA